MKKSRFKISTTRKILNGATPEMELQKYMGEKFRIPYKKNHQFLETGDIIIYKVHGLNPP